MRVLQLVKTSVGAVWAFRQMRELVIRGVEVHVALPAGGPLTGQYIAAGIQVHELDYNLSKLFSVCRKLRRIVGEVQPDVVHSHFVLTTLVMRLALRQTKIPRVFQVPGPLHLENCFFRTLEIGLSQPCDFWIASCRWTENRYRDSGISPQRLFLSYYGSDLDFVKKQPGRLKQTLGLKPDDTIVGMVAYMYAPKRWLGQRRGLKGHEDFIDALSRLTGRYPNLYGVCIGGAWANAGHYEKQVREYGRRKCGDRLFFMGNRSDVPALYGDMDLVVHPSHSENLGGAAESLLLGVPTVATRVGGFPDIVIDRKSGLLVPPRSPQALAVAIEEMITGRCDTAQFRQEGRNRVRKMLDVKETAGEILTIYKRITDRYTGCLLKMKR